MSFNQEVYNFAIKWLDKFKDTEITYQQILDISFVKESEKLGFRNDDSKVFDDEFKAHYDYSLLGTIIFSTWMLFYELEEKSHQIVESDNRQWFIKNLNRLAVIANDNQDYFHGTLKEIKIMSSRIKLGMPIVGDEVQQNINIDAEGNVSFRGYNFNYSASTGWDNMFKDGRVKNFKLAKNAKDELFQAFKKVFSTAFLDNLAFDIGTWSLKLINSDDVTFEYYSSLNSYLDYDGIDLSVLVRQTLGMNDLDVFNGDVPPDQVQKIIVEYQRNTTRNTKTEIYDYQELLIIDRKTKSIEYQQNKLNDYQYLEKHQFEKGIDDLIDNYRDYYFWGHKIGKEVPKNITYKPLYTITVYYETKDPWIIKGIFDKEGIPFYFDKFIEAVSQFLNNKKDIFNPVIYNKECKGEDDYIYCSVRFPESNRSYYYLTDDESIEVGDFVEVPTGSENLSNTGQVVKIEYFNEAEVPLPLAQTKTIIGLSNEEEINLESFQ